MGWDDFFILLWVVCPGLVLWAAVIVVAALRGGGGRAGKWLLAGGIVNLAATLLVIPQIFITPVFLREHISTVTSSTCILGYGIFVKVIGTVGIICLIYAFWVKFKERNNGAAEQTAP